MVGSGEFRVLNIEPQAGAKCADRVGVWLGEATIAIASACMDRSLADARRGLVRFCSARTVRFPEQPASIPN